MQSYHICLSIVEVTEYEYGAARGKFSLRLRPLCAILASQRDVSLASNGMIVTIINQKIHTLSSHVLSCQLLENIRVEL